MPTEQEIVGSSPTVCFFHYLEMARDPADTVLDLLVQMKEVSMQYSTLEESNREWMRVVVVITLGT